MDFNKTLLNMYTNIKTSKDIFEYLYKNGETPPEKLIKELGLSKAIYETLPKMKDEWKVIKKITKGKNVYYDVIDDFRLKPYTHLNYFEKIRKQEGMEGVLFGDQGEISGRGVFLRAYMNNHSIYGFPHVDEINDFEFKILDPLLMELDLVFDKLKKLKLVFETRKKIEQGLLPTKDMPAICISEDLILHTILFKFFRAIYDVIEQDSGNEKSHRFIIELMKQSCKIGKDIGLNICPKDENSAYPEKSFARWLMPSDLFLKNEELADIFLRRKDIKNDGDWFYNKLNLMTLEQLEEIAKEERDQYMSKGHSILVKDFDKAPILWWYKHKTGKNFYNKELDIDESIAVLSTSSLRESEEYDKNIDLRLDSLFGKQGSFIGGEHPIKIRPKHRKVIEMLDLILFSRPVRDVLSITKFRSHEKIKEFFSDEEIEFMIKIFKSDEWQGHNELEKYIWYQSFEPEGLWHDEELYKLANEEINLLEKKLKGNFSNFSLSEYSSFLEVKYKNNKQVKKNLSDFIEYMEAKIYFKHLKEFRKQEEELFFNHLDGDIT